MALRPWPVTLACGDVGLRPLRQTDVRRWREVRRRNAEWLRPWEATLPMEGLTTGDVIPTFAMMVRRLRREAREGRMLPWALTYQGDLVGQVFALMVLTVAAAEAAIGLAILVVYFRNRGTIAVEDINLMKG